MDLAHHVGIIGCTSIKKILFFLTLTTRKKSRLIKPGLRLQEEKKKTLKSCIEQSSDIEILPIKKVMKKATKSHDYRNRNKGC